MAFRREVFWGFSFLAFLLQLDIATAFVQTSAPPLTPQYSTAVFLFGFNDQATEENIPFIIEALPKQTNPKIYKEIAEMCISAFFNDGKPGKLTAPWKEVQLAYLRTLQQNDLRRRRLLQSDINFMLVARRVVPVQEDDPTSWNSQPLILDFSNVYNWDNGKLDQDLVRGEILGFVEVTKKPYGLGKYAVPDNDGAQMQQVTTTRPFLTNLSVTYNARRSGVGSRLVERCEREVLRLWRKDEIVLEVEEDNDNALAFYRKRGYKLLFENPTSRKYDLSGLWLQQKRCKRFIMRKKITATHIPVSGVEVKSTLDKGMEALLRLRDSVFAA